MSIAEEYENSTCPKALVPTISFVEEGDKISLARSTHSVLLNQVLGFS